MSSDEVVDDVSTQIEASWTKALHAWATSSNAKGTLPRRFSRALEDYLDEIDTLLVEDLRLHFLMKPYGGSEVERLLYKAGDGFSFISGNLDASIASLLRSMGHPLESTPGGPSERRLKPLGRHFRCLAIAFEEDYFSDIVRCDGFEVSQIMGELDSLREASSSTWTPGEVARATTAGMGHRQPMFHYLRYDVNPPVAHVHWNVRRDIDELLSNINDLITREAVDQ